MEIKHRITIYIKSQGAEATPPLGTVIGNFGVSTVNFCKEFNNYTIDLPNHYILEVDILIYTNRTFSFSVKQPPLGPLITLLIKQKLKKKKGKEKLENGILLKSVIELAL
jgi:large subunit ribosomal protein L11